MAYDSSQAHTSRAAACYSTSTSAPPCAAGCCRPRRRLPLPRVAGGRCHRLRASHTGCIHALQKIEKSKFWGSMHTKSAGPDRRPPAGGCGTYGSAAEDKVFGCLFGVIKSLASLRPTSNRPTNPMEQGDTQDESTYCFDSPLRGQSPRLENPRQDKTRQVIHTWGNAPSCNTKDKGTFPLV